MKVKQGISQGLTGDRPNGGVSVATGIIQNRYNERVYAFDLGRPASQGFPSTNAEVATAGFSGTVLAGWAMKETSGTTLADFSGNTRTLTINNTTAGFAGQRAVGLFDGSSFRSQRCLELLDMDHTVTLASISALEFDWTTPWSVLVAFRTPTNSAGEGLLGKGVGSNNGSTSCWRVSVSAGGSVYARVGDGASNTAIATASGNVADGAWHWAYIRFDPITDTIKVDTDLATGASVSTTAITTVANGGSFRLGTIEGLSGSSAFQIRGLLVLSGVDTTVAAIQAWWRQGAIPNGMTYTRASSFHGPVADDATEGDVVAGWTTGTVAYEYNSLITTNPLKIGVAVDVAHTNLLPNTDVNNTTAFATSGGTRANYNADSPRGFREAVKHTKTAEADMILGATSATTGGSAAVTINVVASATIWCRWDGVGTAPELRVYRADGTTLIGTTSATDSTNKWRRLRLTFTPPATESVRIAWSGAAAASTSGAAWFAMPMVNSEDYARPWIPTKGATASTAAIVLYASVPGLTNSRGTIKAWFTMRQEVSTTQSTRGVAHAAPGVGSLVAERSIYVAGYGPILMWDGSASAITAVISNLTTVENIVVGQWNLPESQGWAKRIVRGPGGFAATTAVDLAGTEAPVSIVYVGSRAGITQLTGIVSKIVVYPYVELDL